MKKNKIKLCEHCVTEEDAISDEEMASILSSTAYDTDDELEQIEKENRIIHINYDIDSLIYDRVTRLIHKYNLEDDLENIAYEDRTPIKLHIHSNGGSLHDGLTVVNAIVSSRTPVYTYAECTVASMAFMIYVAGHYRYARKFNDFMYHDVSFDVGGTATEVRRSVDSIVKLRDICDDFIIERTNITLSQINEVFKSNRDWHFFSEEALELGVCHEII